MGNSRSKRSTPEEGGTLETPLRQAAHRIQWHFVAVPTSPAAVSTLRHEVGLPQYVTTLLHLEVVWLGKVT